MSLSSLLGVRPPNEAVSQWHTSAPVDLLAYAFSWVWVIIPLALAGDSFRVDYLGVYLLVLTFTDVHRHYAIPYTYLDSEVFKGYRTRFVVFPVVMFGLWVTTPFILKSGHRLTVVEVGVIVGALVGLIRLLRQDTFEDSPRSSAYVGLMLWTLSGWCVGKAVSVGGNFGDTTFRASNVYGGIAVFAGLWNIWHVYNQKYGILRLYNAKSESPSKTPGWVDRLLIWGWLPLYLTVLAPRYGDYVFRLFPRGRKTLGPVFSWITDVNAYLLAPSIALVAFSLLAFVIYEARATRFRNKPRLCMFIGTTALATTFLWMHPLKAYLAYAFSHAVEYIVFVWAFQRRRYHTPLPHNPTLAKILKRPMLAHLGFILVLGGAFLYLKYFGRWIFTDFTQPRLAGFSTAEWIGYWTVYQSMVHFYFDGFLWKMRRASVRANI